MAGDPTVQPGRYLDNRLFVELSLAVLVFDHRPALYVPPSSWECTYCPLEGNEDLLADNDGGCPTTVEWLAVSISVDGRCRACGQKYILTRAYEAVPSVEEQTRNLPRRAEPVLGVPASAGKETASPPSR